MFTAFGRTAEAVWSLCSGLFLHINWGYSGLYDGYYYKGNFDMAQREDYDDVIDTNPYTGNGSTSYSIGIEYIIY